MADRCLCYTEAMIKTDENGFGVVEIIMGIVIIALLGVVGYLGYQSMQKKQDADTHTAATSTETKPKTDDSKAVLDNVQAFYKKYLNSISAGEAEQNSNSTYPTTAWVSDNYATQTAANQHDNATGYDPVTCSQNPLSYDKYKFSSPVLKGTTGTVTITGTYAESGDVIIKANLVKDGTTWKINKFDCLK